MTLHIGATSTVLAILSVPLLVVAFPSAARGAEGLWGTENLLAGPPLKAGETVTVRFCGERSACCDGGACAKPGGRECARKKPCAMVSRGTVERLAARIVKVLPNGNAVLEVRAWFGEGYLLISGEAARADISVNRAVSVGRLSNLAIVARKIDKELLGGVLRLVPRARVASDKRSPKGVRR